MGKKIAAANATTPLFKTVIIGALFVLRANAYVAIDVLTYSLTLVMVDIYFAPTKNIYVSELNDVLTPNDKNARNS